MKFWNVRMRDPFGEWSVKQIRAQDELTARARALYLYGEGNVYAVSLAR
jgi:hypothetical protein